MKMQIAFIPVIKNSGINGKSTKEIKLLHPPKKRIAVIPDIKIILLYSAKKNKAKPIAEYSTL